MSGKRSPEQVHEEDGHATPVSSCSLCTTEAEHDRNADQARAELVEESLTFLASEQEHMVGETGPELYVRPAATSVLPRKRGECVEDGCTNKGNHRDGRCCGCHRRPGRTA